MARARLLVDHGVAEGTLDELEAGVAAELAAVEEAALAAPFPEPDAPASEFKQGSE